LLSATTSGHRLSKPKSKELVQKVSDVTSVIEDKEKEKESTTAQTEEDLDPNAMFAFS
jgi:hypothetical protein